MLSRGSGDDHGEIQREVLVSTTQEYCKGVLRGCNTCKRFQAIAVPTPPTGNLPRDQTEGDCEFQVVGVDFAGPIRYSAKEKLVKKAYVILYACSLSRAVYMELLPSQETTEFLRSQKHVIARRGRPHKIYSVGIYSCAGQSCKIFCWTSK